MNHFHYNLLEHLEQSFGKEVSKMQVYGTPRFRIGRSKEDIEKAVRDL